MVFQPVRCVQIDGQRRPALHVVQDPVVVVDFGDSDAHAVYEGAVYALDDVAVHPGRRLCPRRRSWVSRVQREQAVFNAITSTFAVELTFPTLVTYFSPIAGVACIVERLILPVEIDLDVQIAAAGDALGVVSLP